MYAIYNKVYKCKQENTLFIIIQMHRNS